MTEWNQYRVLHCPNKECNGMLLENDKYFYYKCSDCHHYFMSETKLVDITERLNNE